MTEIKLEVGQVWFDPTFQDTFTITGVHHDVGFGNLSSDIENGVVRLTHFDSKFLSENMQLVKPNRLAIEESTFRPGNVYLTLDDRQVEVHWAELLGMLLKAIDTEGSALEWKNLDGDLQLQTGNKTNVEIIAHAQSNPNVNIFRGDKCILAMRAEELMWAIQQVASKE